MHGVRIGGRMDRYGADTHFLAGPVNAKRDFTAIGDQNFFEQLRPPSIR
jgi:hypothetical protein